MCGDGGPHQGGGGRCGGQTDVHGHTMMHACRRQPWDGTSSGGTGVRERGRTFCLIESGVDNRVGCAQVGISEICAEVSPGGEAESITFLQRGSCVVLAMVGGGMNDSPALSAADVGMGIWAGTDIAIEDADYVLVRNHLGDVIMGIDFSRKTLSWIRVCNGVQSTGYPDSCACFLSHH